MEKDLKLRSKVSVDVVKLARRGSSDGAAVVAAAAPKPLHDRPAPASVKMARSKLAEDILSGYYWVFETVLKIWSSQRCTLPRKSTREVSITFE